jgi:RNA polymerase sigma-70 factor (ECF subfamily)
VTTERNDGSATPDRDGLARRFEAERGRLHAIAYRMLGSAAEAEDVIQETWLRLARVAAEEIDNLPAWLTTVLSRVCLDLLRTRQSRREDRTAEDIPALSTAPDPAQEAEVVESVGRALLVVLDTLSPAERVAFVLHEVFAVPFGEIAPILDRTPATTKKLASRARAKIHGTPTISATELSRARRVADAFLAAARTGDLTAVLAVLAPDVVRTADPAALPAGRALRAQGADRVAGEIVIFGRDARFAQPALVNGGVGIVVAPHGVLLRVITLTSEGDRITGYDMIADPARLGSLELAVLEDPFPWS